MRPRAAPDLLDVRSMPSLTLILQHLELALRLQAALPAIAPEVAYAHAMAATSAATDALEPELLLAIAFVESRFDPTAVSRVEGNRRRVGPYPSTRPPRRLKPRSSLFCGPLQTYATTWEQCLAMRDLGVGYAAAVDELEQWLRDKRVRGDVGRALAGHGCGNHGVTTGRCNRYPARVLRIHRRLGVDQARARRAARAKAEG